jgi:hypothetical protein
MSTYMDVELLRLVINFQGTAELTLAEKISEGDTCLRGDISTELFPTALTFNQGAP